MVLVVNSVNTIEGDRTNEYIMMGIKYVFILYAVYIILKREYDRLDDKTKEKIKENINRILKRKQECDINE